MVKNLLVIFLLYFFSANGLAQVLEFSQVEKLPEAVNSSAEESLPLLSPSGNTLYFTRFASQQNIGGKFSGIDIWVSERDGNAWKKASNKRLRFNNKGSNAVVGMSLDSKILYLIDTSPNKKIKGVYFSKKNKGGNWSSPELVPIPGIDSDGFIGFYVSTDFDVIFISMKGADSMGEEDLYISVKDAGGKWSVPKNLGSTINTVGFEISPFFSQTQKRLYFASNGHGGEGDADIFYCDRLYDSWETWSAPKNLGSKINSKNFDGYLSLYGDSLVFFSSNRSGQLSDIYQAKAKMVTRYDNKNYLTERKLETVLGTNINRKFAFVSGVTDLSQAQKELLWYVANKILSMNEIRIELIAQKADAKDSKAVYEKRLNAMVEYLQLAGIDKSRIKASAVNPAEKSNGGNKEDLIELLLYE